MVYDVGIRYRILSGVSFRYQRLIKQVAVDKITYYCQCNRPYLLLSMCISSLLEINNSHSVGRFPISSLSQVLFLLQFQIYSSIVFLVFSFNLASSYCLFLFLSSSVLICKMNYYSVMLFDFSTNFQPHPFSLRTIILYYIPL